MHASQQDEPSDCSLIARWALSAEGTTEAPHAADGATPGAAGNGRGHGIALIPTTGPRATGEQPFPVPPV